MTQEEKAKVYDRVSKEVKDYFEGKQKLYSDVTKTLEHLFPELKENEDERIKNFLMMIIDKYAGISNEEKKKCLAWLEKQAEQKSVYVVTRSEEHSDYVEAVFLNEDKAEEYCNPFNEDEDSYARNITKIKIQ